MKQISVGIIGVSGYTGLELLKLLLAHPVFKVCYLANTQGECRIDEIHKGLYGICDLEVQKADAKVASQMCELVFLALPHKEAMNIAKMLLASGTKVVDLSADYRLNADNYACYYCEHQDQENLAHAVYGLPEYNKEAIKRATLIANPGCYPTATLLALLPFVDYIDEEYGVFVDAKSGVSGAGKGLTNNTHYPHINENLFSYSPLAHRHQIEIEEKCEIFKHKPLQVQFVPHFTPLTRGMLVSVFAHLKQTMSSSDALDILKNAYSAHSFIRIREKPVDISSVSGSNFCDIFVQTRNKSLYVNSSIDNLMRGASSQALLNANLMCGLDEDLGIPRTPYGIF